ncbi:putative RNA-directed DNA polymerase from transposon X-element [Trichonephila clavipes]|uniref:Putative RNA-directed DNA polymerase from transposon X-element n=1 Tax=Trichonephila clavipes TaxID=2585209 RepID=A0A8X7BDV7_TRICX|nr:putative RNA-directed DNA polymerase from transposon X-element [Trichonephila clavipes]
MQETHLRPNHNIRIPNYICYRNDRNMDENVYGGTLILIKRNIPHFNLPTPPLQHIEATIVVLTPPNLIPLSIISIYVPPRSDGLFTLDLEQLLQTNRNCVIFGDLNVIHNEWNCSVNSTRGKQLKTFIDLLDLTIAYPDTPTRFGYRTSNTLDIVVINNFHFPFTIDSIPELSSDHNPVFLNFSLSTPNHSDKPTAVTTCWSDFRNNLKSLTRLSDFTGIRNPYVLEEKISLLTTNVRSAHIQASMPIENKHHTFIPKHIQDLIYLKNKAKRTYNKTLNPIHRTNYYRAQAQLKKALKIHSQQSWTNRL